MTLVIDHSLGQDDGRHKDPKWEDDGMLLGKWLHENDLEDSWKNLALVVNSVCQLEWAEGCPDSW